MKKTLLSFTILIGLGLTGYSQTSPFQAQTSNIPVNNRFGSIQTVDANVAWGVVGATPATGQSFTPTRYARTIDGGTTWVQGVVSVTTPAAYGLANISAVSATTAWATAYPSAGAGGSIVKTTDGGATWTRQATAAFSSPTSFANWVHFFNATDGVCMGDPSTQGTSVEFFEIYTTTNGGTTWTRVPRTPAITTAAEEYGVVNQFYAFGNTIWFLTGYVDGDFTPVKVLRSTDKGVTWTVGGPTDFTVQASGIAFSSATNGLVWQGSDLEATTDGGDTWTARSYSTPFRTSDVAAIPGSNVFISVGVDARVTGTGPFPLSDFGASISRDLGATWQDIATSAQYTAVSFASPTAGYVGGVAQATTTPPGVTTSVAKYVGPSILSNRNAELQKALAVYPNPSNSGIFTVQLASGLKSGASVRVVDVVGRQVASQQLNATAIATNSTTVDLSKEKAGIYTLELRTEAGVAQQKLVIE